MTGGDAKLRRNLGRAAHVSPPARRVYRALVDGIVGDDATPDASDLAVTTALDAAAVDAALTELATADWLALDGRRITAVYPFALAPTGMRVRIGQAEREAMCAIDALGVAPMLDREVEIGATCVWCGQPITARVRPAGIASRRPRGAVVVRRRAVGPAHATRCAATRFACSPAHADAWIARDGQAGDVMLSLEVAFMEAREIFEDAYRVHGAADAAV